MGSLYHINDDIHKMLVDGDMLKTIAEKIVLYYGFEEAFQYLAPFNHKNNITTVLQLLSSYDIDTICSHMRQTLLKLADNKMPRYTPWNQVGGVLELLDTSDQFQKSCAMRMLAGISTQNEYIIQAGGVQPIAEQFLMPLNPEIEGFALMALAHVTTNIYVRYSVAAMPGMVTTLVQRLSSNLVDWIFRVMSNLADREDVKIEIVTAGGIQPIVRLLQDGHNEGAAILAKLATSTCTSTPTSTSTPTNKLTYEFGNILNILCMVQAGAIPAAVQSLNSEWKAQGLLVLLAVLTTDEQQVRSNLDELETQLSALDSHTAELCRAQMEDILSGKINYCTLVAHTNNAIPFVSKLLVDKSPAIVSSAALVLSHLARDDSIADMIINNDEVPSWIHLQKGSKYAKINLRKLLENLL